jgi:hypothetical protein
MQIHSKKLTISPNSTFSKIENEPNLTQFCVHRNASVREILGFREPRFPFFIASE